MIKQIVFTLVLLTSIGVLFWTFKRVFAYFKLTKSQPLSNWDERIKLTLKVALGQSKIFRFPLAGMLHAIVFWGFIVILFGSLEMIIDGLSGKERALSFLGYLYDFLMAFGDIFAFLIAIVIFILIVRRLFVGIKRFDGIEMEHKSHYDAIIALFFIFFLMISLLGINTFYIVLEQEHYAGIYPVSAYIADNFQLYNNAHFWFEFSWWFHIVLILVFANVLPYSKHFHVFMSVPSVMLTRLKPLAYIDNMPDITKEVKLMMDPSAAFEDVEEEEISRFGAKDIEDLTWVNYLNSLACTECGRCTSVCPANQTGKLLSPRKIMMNTRARMKEKGPGMLQEGTSYDDGRSLIRDFISEEELWACTLCNACAQECPININHPSIIVQLRRYLVMEEAAAPAELNAVFSNIENNAAPWQYAQDDRMNWAEGLQINES